MFLGFYQTERLKVKGKSRGAVDRGGRGWGVFGSGGGPDLTLSHLSTAPDGKAGFSLVRKINFKTP
jgi:hypothetical protein